MIFNSLVFLLFFALVLALYHRFRHRQQNILLLIASWVFYGWWDWRFLGLLLFTSLFDYACGRFLENTSATRKRKWIVAMSVAMNLSVLGFFKYFDFFAGSFARVLASLGMQADFPTLHIILPVGISFYTFVSMSYTIDVYRGHIKPSRNLVDFLLFVSFFPQLAAGPIMRAKDLLPQCVNPRTVSQSQFIDGIWLCIVGYLKKVVIADRLAPMVNAGFGAGGSPFDDAASWLILYAFAFQIYGDFSGYTDIARGISKMMGFELTHNFKAPYLVSNPAAFWRNWHISLSNWLRDYLYIPLGGNRGGWPKTFRNLMLTMLLGGLWHGAGVAYIAWGLYHGLLLALHRIWQKIFPSSQHSKPKRLVGFLHVVIFFHITCIGWLLFRAGSVNDSTPQAGVILRYLGQLWRWPDETHGLLWPVILLGSLALLLQWKDAAMNRFSQWSLTKQFSAVLASLTAILALGNFEGSSFIYFQF